MKTQTHLSINIFNGGKKMNEFYMQAEARELLEDFEESF
jgi:hypothetical protein